MNTLNACANAPSRDRGAGFSLVEMMIAITILGVGLLSLAGLFPLAMERVSVGDHDSRATFHAKAKIEIQERSLGSTGGRGRQRRRRREIPEKLADLGKRPGRGDEIGSSHRELERRERPARSHADVSTV
jgi:prepilin-type N-terminal cleavage/methylation domain-containing protein